MTIILAWSEEEAARYLETFKAFEGKDATLIQKREQTNFVDQITDVLTSVKSVNKTDAAQLLGHFGSLKGVIAASIDQLGLMPGLGPKKVRRLYDTFHKPFSSVAARRRKEESAENENRVAEEQKESVTVARESDMDHGATIEESKELQIESDCNPSNQK
jgi:ERCC4-type nuclease